MKVIYEPKGRAKEYADLALNDYIGCENACVYCLHPDTPILMYDGTVKTISDISVGDAVIGIQDSHNRKYREYSKATVENKWITKALGYKITLSDGREIICSRNHRWLTDRKWKSTVAQENDKTWLTENNFILGLGTSLTSTPHVTEEYMKGYLSGMIRGDANLGIYHYHRKKTNKKESFYRFRLAIKDIEGVERTKDFLCHFGVSISMFEFQMKDRSDGRWKNYKEIRTSKEQDYYSIENIIKWNDAKEYRRGFLAGIYDAEGSNYHITESCRICNADDAIISFICSSLDIFGFKYNVESIKYTTDKRLIRNVRLLGGIEERVRFFSLCNPAITKLTTLCGSKVKSPLVKENNRIIKVECIGETLDLVDISTSTSNFIANGLISHNCFAPSVMRSDREVYHQTVKPRTEAVRKWFEKDCIELEKNGDKRRVHMNFVSDPYPEIEAKLHLTRFCIETATKHGIGINILTKGKYDTVRPDFDVFKSNGTHFGVTCAFMDDSKRLDWEPRASTVSERLRLLKEAHELGMYTWVSMEPVVIPEQALEFFLSAHQWVDLWKVGKLNYHPHAKEVDWPLFRDEFRKLADKVGAKYVIKKDLLEAR